VWAVCCGGVVLAAAAAFARRHAVSSTPALATNDSEMRPDRLFTDKSGAVVRVVTLDTTGRPLKQGSAFFVDADGLLVTNYHVMADCASARILFDNDVEIGIDSIAAVDPQGDLALVRVSGREFKCLRLADAEAPPVGTRVYAIGTPQGLTNSLSQGLVSGIRRIAPDLLLLQTTAPISPGSSGGPLLTADGNVIGVNTLYLVGGQNLNFAVGTARVKRLLDIERRKLVPAQSLTTEINPKRDGEPKGASDRLTSVLVARGFSAPNKRSGRNYLYRITVHAVVRATDETAFKRILEQHRVQFNGALREGIRQSDPQDLDGRLEPRGRQLGTHLGSEFNRIIEADTIVDVQVTEVSGFLFEWK
jgi:S1-C subfamily serine protease